MSNKAKLLFNSLLVFASISHVHASDEPVNVDSVGSYSYFSFGMESVSYEERLKDSVNAFGREIPFSIVTDGQVSSPTIRTGGLYHVTDTFDFSMDSSATFAPTADDEIWIMNIDLPEMNISGTNDVQKNDFTFTDATTTGLIQFKYTEHLRFAAGAEFAMHTFKRSNITSLSQLVTVDASYTEEVVANINLLTGLVYESGALVNSENMFSAKALIGLPVWTDVLNSVNSDVSFNETGGYNFLTEARYTFKFKKGFNLGFFATYRLTERELQTKTLVTDMDGSDIKRKVSIPAATTSAFALGLSVAWDL